MNSDLINGGFETTGAILTFVSIHKLYHSKRTDGVSWMPILVFTLWGYWNLFYYPELGQWASLSGAVLMTFANSVWVAQIIHYRKREANGNSKRDD